MPLHGKLGEAHSPEREGKQSIYGAAGKPASITLGIQDPQGSQEEACLLCEPLILVLETLPWDYKWSPA